MSSLGDITFYRGDSFPLTLTIKDKNSGNPIDLTGYSFRVTVNVEKDPIDTTNQLFEVVGSLDPDPTTGRVSFTPTQSDTNQKSGTYYYDIEMTDDAGNVRTIAKHKFKITQDLSK